DNALDFDAEDLASPPLRREQAERAHRAADVDNDASRTDHRGNRLLEGPHADFILEHHLIQACHRIDSVRSACQVSSRSSSFVSAARVAPTSASAWATGIPAASASQSARSAGERFPSQWAQIHMA